MSAYYNEHDAFAAQWLRNLIAAGHIAPGVVDERDIQDVRPDDLREFEQCHFFAGIGGWSLALRLAGWADDRRIWTGSCPCQPFSAAGKGDGLDDERHLWPSWFWLIAQCRPAIVVGEQVASKDAEPWLDLVRDDMEGLGHAFAAVAFPAASIGAPHIRDRCYWLGYADDERSQRHAGHDGAARWEGPQRSVAASGVSGGVADLDLDGRIARAFAGLRTDAERHAQSRGAVVGLADGARGGWREERADAARFVVGDGAQGNAARSSSSSDNGTDPLDGFWRGADWLFCRDGKWRPVEPGAFPLADGIPERVGRLRGYGNAIVPQQAAEIVRILMEHAP